ncbi:hypothetical protein Btru_077693 [Bulinus truncatus]|nr:hypothetical protein Btru_077693 [Bulinus truncatus]
MAEENICITLNDAILFRTIQSGCSSDVFGLVQICGSNIKAFSNDALNKSVIPACYLGNAWLIQFLLQDGARLEVRDNDGNTPLLICSKNGISDVVRFLLTMGANVNAANNDGDTALFLSTSRDVILLLLGQIRINLNHRNIQGNTALMAAIEHVQLEKVKWLINSGICPNIHDTVKQCTCLNNNVLNSSGSDNALVLANRKGVGRLVRLFYQSRRVKLSPLLLAANNSDFQSCNLLLSYNLCEVNEVLNMSTILCLVLSRIQQEGIFGDTEIELVRRICKTGLNVNTCDTCDNSDLTNDRSTANNDIVLVKEIKSHTSNRSPLKIALEIGHYELVNILCAHGAKISHDDIVLTVDKHHVHLIPMLLGWGARINKTDEKGLIEYPKSALDVALSSSDEECVSVLIFYGAHLDVQYAVKQTIIKNNEKILNFLIEKRRKESERVIQNDPDLIHTAANNKDVGILKLLLEAGADINVVLNNQTPLMQAVHIDVMKFILENGADVNLKTNTTALIHLLSTSYQEMLQKTFGIKLKSKKITKKLLKMVILYLKYDVMLDDTDEDGNTALITCCIRSDKTKILKILLEEGSNVNHCNSQGFSPLHYSVINKDLNETKLLLNFGAIVNMKSKDGITPLHRAIDNVDAVRYLLENHAEANAQDCNGDTALLLASNSELDLNETIDVLIGSGCDVNRRNNAGMSALFLAAENLKEVCMNKLLDAHCEFDYVIYADRKPKSVLSIVLNKWFHNDVSQRMALTLLKHGATSRYVRPDVIHRLILTGNGELIQKLILSGLCPSDIILNEKLFGWPFLSISPFVLCLMIDHINMAQFFIDHWYLTKSDITVLSRNKSIADCGEITKIETFKFLEKISSQPLRLELLCFISVSSVLGSGRDRREKIQKCPIPNILQDCLMYNNFELKFIDTTGAFLHDKECLKMFTIYQNFEEDIDFYDKDEFYFEIDSDSDIDGSLISSVDSLGNTSASPEDIKDKKPIMSEMCHAVSLNSRGYHAFLLIIKYSNRLTDEDKKCVGLLKEVFGIDFMKQYGILVVTGGDLLEDDFPEQEETFEAWCREQEISNVLFSHIFNECGKRAVLFNNRTSNQKKIKKQLKNLIKLVNKLPNGGERFSGSHFLQAREMLGNANIKSEDVLAGENIMEMLELIKQLKDWIAKQDIDNQLRYLKTLQGSVKTFYKTLKEKSHHWKFIKEIKKLVKSTLKNITTNIDELEDLFKYNKMTKVADEELQSIERNKGKLYQELQHIETLIRKRPKEITRLQRDKADVKGRISEEEKKYAEIMKAISEPGRKENKVMESVLIDYDRRLKDILATSTAKDEEFVKLYEEKKKELQEKLKKIGSSSERCKIM